MTELAQQACPLGAGTVCSVHAARSRGRNGKQRAVVQEDPSPSAGRQGGLWDSPGLGRVCPAEERQREAQGAR